MNIIVAGWCMDFSTVPSQQFHWFSRRTKSSCLSFCCSDCSTERGDARPISSNFISLGRFEPVVTECRPVGNAIPNAVSYHRALVGLTSSALPFNRSLWDGLLAEALWLSVRCSLLRSHADMLLQKPVL